MRLLDSNTGISGASGVTPMSKNDMERADTSSDSAVSSMGSERVPSLSDGECKIRPYDYSQSSRHLNEGIGSSESARLPPVAQKKHQMFGKRYFQDQSTASAAHSPQTPLKYEYRDTATASYVANQPEGAVGPRIPEMKYSCSMEFGLQIRGAMQRPVSRDKSKQRKSEDEHLTRDEKRARALNVPISVDDIINLPMDEFNERLSKYDLSEAQLSLIRDIRRRGKNKVAAQNCRKRKLDQILSLADEVKEMRDRKLRLINDHEFSNLRDSDGNQYSPYQYSLQTTADGSILMVPRSNSTVSNPDRKDLPQNQKD
ncbi:hypothetical protein NQ314_007894 [Rhamnusium bicolor]|uniref:BZIP domain-containing protein n=1 Tax=Rhamnusium bicolor TaxID=1586634 RepID=A0AAV8YG05_9CUCU|nr:hypothetical protein NQ314_007894 [Rhamnusium bicolor]